jgi:hypothetical protein
MGPIKDGPQALESQNGTKLEQCADCEPSHAAAPSFRPHAEKIVSLETIFISAL